MFFNSGVIFAGFCSYLGEEKQFILIIFIDFNNGGLFLSSQKIQTNF